MQTIGDIAKWHFLGNIHFEVWNVEMDNLLVKSLGPQQLKLMGNRYSYS